MSLARHDLADVVEVIFLREFDDVFLRHKVADRHGLVDQTGCCVGVIRCRNDCTAALLCQFADRKGYTCALADDNAACFHLDGAKLGLIAVSENDQVMFLDVVLHQVRVCGRDQDFSAVKICLRIADYHTSFQSIKDVRVLRARF